MSAGKCGIYVSHAYPNPPASSFSVPHCSWRAWTRQGRQKAARQRAALAVYERRLLGAALRQWRWVQHSKVSLGDSRHAKLQSVPLLSVCQVFSQDYIGQ